MFLSEDIELFENEENINGLINALDAMDQSVRKSAASALGRITAKNAEEDHLKVINQYQQKVQDFKKATKILEKQLFVVLNKLSVMKPDEILINGYSEDFVESLYRHDTNLQKLYANFNSINPPVGFETAHKLYLKAIEYRILKHMCDIKYYIAIHNNNENDYELRQISESLNQKVLEADRTAQKAFYIAAVSL
jgi:hypothetical protein